MRGKFRLLNASFGLRGFEVVELEIHRDGVKGFGDVRAAFDETPRTTTLRRDREALGHEKRLMMRGIDAQDALSEVRTSQWREGGVRGP